MDDLKFGELRSLLSQPPSEQGWRALCALVEGGAWTARAEEWLPYAEEALERGWPQELRVMPRLWLLAAVTPAAARLGRVLRVTRAATGEQERLIGRLAELEGVGLEALTVLDELKSKQLNALLDAPACAALRVLVMEEALLTDRSVRSVRQHAPRLERLKLARVTYEDAGVMLAHARWPRLRALGLPGYSELHPDDLASWLKNAPELEELDLYGRRCDEALVMLCAQPLPKLRVLHLDHVSFSPQMYDALVGAPWLHQLGGIKRGPYSRPYSADSATQAALDALHEELAARAAGG